MIELLKKQLIDYQNQYEANLSECISLMKADKEWKTLAQKGAGLKSLIECTIIEMKKYT